MTPDQSWLSVWANSVPGELLFLLIPPRSGSLTAAACVFGPVHGEVSSYLSETWTPWWGSSLPLLMMVCRDAECWRRQALCIDWVNTCIWWWISRSGICWGKLREDFWYWKKGKQVIYSSQLIQMSYLRETNTRSWFWNLKASCVKQRYWCL